jgi:hypothetical protein
MKRRSLFNFAAPAVLAAVLALIVVSCAQQSESPVAPSLVRGGSFNTDVPPEPDPSPTPTPTGTPCSPGYWKNHESAFTTYCSAAAAIAGDAFATCGDLLTAITCTGNEPGCTGARRQAAAAALNTVSGCTESD